MTRTLDELAVALDDMSIRLEEHMLGGSYHVAAWDAAKELAAHGAAAVPILAARLTSTLVVQLPDGAVEGQTFPGGQTSLAEVAAWGLMTIGAPAAHTLPAMVEAWWRATGNTRDSLQHWVVELSRHAEPGVAATALVALAGDPDPEQRRALAHRLWRLGAPAYEAACVLAADPELEVRALGAEARRRIER